MATSLQVVNISDATVQIGLGSTQVSLASAYRSATFATGCTNVDVAVVGSVGERDIQRLLAAGKIIVLPASTLS